MAHEGIYATSAECIAKAGKGYNSTDVDEAMINDFCAQVEAEINVYATMKNPVTTSTKFAALPVTKRQVLSLVTSNKVGIYMIQYDMSGYTSRTEAEDMMIVLNVGAKKALAGLKDKEAQTYMEED